MTRNPQVTTRVHPDQKDQLERIAYEKSSPGDRVHRSEVVREAIQEYIQRWEEAEKE